MSSEGARIVSYRDLVAWQEAMRLAEAVYAVSAELPADERFGLMAQLRRAAISIPSNLAEGHARESIKDFARYISIARGSLAEVETQLHLAERLNMIYPEQVQPVFAHCDELGRILRGLRKSLDAKLAAAFR